MNLSDWQDYVYKSMDEKGFHSDRTNTGRDDTLVRLCLIHTEVSEAADIVKKHGLTKSNLHEFALELADIQIRLLDLAGCVDINLEEATKQKMEINMKRPYKYGTPDAEKSTN